MTMPRRALLGALLGLLLMASAGATHAQDGRATANDADAELAFIERLYEQGDAYRAESEALRFVRQRPRHPQRGAVELARAKLYYRAERYDEAALMLYALLDRSPPPATEQAARRLLSFTHLHRGDLARAAETADALPAPGGPDPLEELRAAPPGAVDPDAAETWSTWLPGSGYFLLGEPGKATAAITLNLALLGLVALSVDQENAPAALLFLALEGMLWQGGRSGVRQDAEALTRRLARRRLDSWLARQGERELLGVGISLHFGGG